VPDARRNSAERRLAYSRQPETDVEVCSSLQSVQGFAAGEGIWRRLDREVRRRQLGHMISLCDELYPTFRWFLFDGLRSFCWPMTIFGPQRAALYSGEVYFVFNSTGHIRTMTQQFDNLIRAAVVQPPEIGRYLNSLLQELDQNRP
jgi:hypothetical protein